jgi:hypothetical protein
MKTIKIILLLASMSCIAQTRSTLSIGTEPNAIVKDGFNASLKFTYQMEKCYLGAAVFTFPELNKVGYNAIYGFGGINFTLDRWNENRVYTGVLLGYAYREGNTYPLVGYEAGYEYYITEWFGVGVNGSMHYRADAEFYDGSKNVFNGEFKIIFVL